MSVVRPTGRSLCSKSDPVQGPRPSPGCRIRFLDRSGLHLTVALAGDGPLRDGLRERGAQDGLDLRMLGSVGHVRPLWPAPTSLTSFSPRRPEQCDLGGNGAGKAVVATDVGGNREALGDTGILVPPANPAALAAAIGMLLGDSQLRGQLGDAASNELVRCLKSQRWSTPTSGFYEDLLSRDRRCAGSSAS